MAIFHMSFSNISAGKGRSAIAGASYRSGEKLFDQKEGRSYFYARSVMPESFILTPKNAPEWASDREQLWNEVDRKIIVVKDAVKEVGKGVCIVTAAI